VSRAKRVTLLVGTHLIAIAIGGFATYEYFIRDAVRGMTILGELSVSSMQESLVNLQRDTGTDQEYEQALRDYLSVLQRLDAANPDAQDAEFRRMSKIIVLGRLALVVEKRGAAEEAAQFVDAAERECKVSSRADCSPKKLRELALYFDRVRTTQGAK
jgi:hypothetical protein